MESTWILMLTIVITDDEGSRMCAMDWSAKQQYLGWRTVYGHHHQLDISNRVRLRWAAGALAALLCGALHRGCQLLRSFLWPTDAWTKATVKMMRDDQCWRHPVY